MLFENDFFIKSPQEFFASISNQWFSDSFHTLDLAIARFQKGYREPINQFLFFADTFSEGGEKTLFYTLNTEGNINQTIVPFRRNIHGYIKSLDFNGTRYTFILDEMGYVINITRSSMPEPEPESQQEPKQKGIPGLPCLAIALGLSIALVFRERFLT